MHSGNYVFLTLLLFLFGCHSNQDTPPQFELLRKDVTGLDFENELKPGSQFNVFNYMYFFNGGGVAAEDFNNDGLTDLFFTSNMGPNKLFLNEGNFTFRDVTDQAGVAGIIGWSSGASVTDINQDGLLDIYVSQVGDYLTIKGQNQLFICQSIEDGVPVYQDQSIRYGLDLIGFSTQAAFFDYDLDGDLDMYQLNHSLHENGTFGEKLSFEGTRHPQAGDKLFRNEGGTFTEVTLDAGIKSTVIGYGLGIVTGDINLDGWPDIYIGNDFHENDYLYINQQDGTFKEVLTDALMHTSRFSMGVDMADINNDGWNDIISLDMLPEDPFILKSSLGEDDYDIFHFKLTYGYNYQFARNNLQLNKGVTDDGKLLFSEIGMFAGIHATDWSWAPLFLDFDHDGHKDLFISNGIPRRMNDIDYVNYMANNELRWKRDANVLEEDDLVVVEKMPQIKLPNKFFRNTQDLRFEDMKDQVLNRQDSYSNGAVYADLDNDGDLDIVVNNIEDEPFIYKNLTVENGTGGDWLDLDLEGPEKNRRAIGARAIVYKKEEKLVCENYTVRGYQSCLPAGLHMGIGDRVEVDSVVVIWTDGTYEKLTGLQYNQKNKVTWKKGLPAFDFKRLRAMPPAPFGFEEVTAATQLDFKHEETAFIEFHRERLIPQMVSTEGPAVAVGDLNGDGLEDVFFGSSKWEKNRLYLQQPDGTFVSSIPEAFQRDSVFEDVAAVIIDLDNDGDMDIVPAAGGNEFWNDQEPMKQRAYFNDGQGNFVRKDFEGIYMTASCVLPADFNGDGHIDLFFGGRSVPWKYGITPRSYLLENQGDGTFKDVAESVGDGLHEAGLVKNGSWADMDGDGDQDLVLALEWAPVTVFYNEKGRFSQQPVNDLSGWWNFALPYDFDGDGDMDILAGNLGENAKFQPTKKEPVRLYVNDYDDNDQVEQVLTYYLNGREIPFANYTEITKQLVHLKKKYLMSKDFAKATLPEIFGEEKLKNALKREANTFQSMYFEKTENGFKAHRLPNELQFSTLNAAVLADLNADSAKEVIVAGNFYEANIEMGRYDADFGHVLQISDGGKMQVYPLGNIRVKGQVRRIKPVTVGEKELFMFVKNNDFVQFLRPETFYEKQISENF